MRIYGKLVKWNDDRGFGFIQADGGGPEVFVHVSAFRHRGRPMVGERLRFEIQLGEDGRKRAADVERLRGAGRAQAPKAERTNPLAVLAAAVMVVGIGAGLYTYLSARFPSAHEVTVDDGRGGQTVVTESEDGRFRCDGRQHCSQMSSCAEARFFNRHCPGTLMDGDSDGEPCERGPC